MAWKIIFATACALFITENLLVAAQGPTKAPQTKKEIIVTLDGTAFVAFSSDDVNKTFLTPSDKEKFSFFFQTTEPEGLMYYFRDRFQSQFVALKDGYVLFVDQESRGSRKEVAIGKEEGVKFNDGQWHKFLVNRRGRVAIMTVDDQFPQEFDFPLNPQFLREGEMWLGGAPSVRVDTAGYIKANFKGSIGKVLYETLVWEGTKPIQNVVSLFTNLKEKDLGTGIIVREIDWPSKGVFQVTTTPRPRPKLTSITLKTDPVHIKIDEGPKVRIGSSCSFKFRTFKPKGLLMYSASSPSLIDVTFMALELYDGNLYFVYNFGGETKSFMCRGGKGVNDGQTHTVSVEFSNPVVVVSLDDRGLRMELDLDESVPTNLGPLYIGGYVTPNIVPWHTWSREGYQGCIEDLKINGDVIDLEPFVSNQIYGSVERRCSQMPNTCSSIRPCKNNGTCTNTWSGYMCDCAGTDFMGQDCDIPAWTGVFNGSNSFHMVFRPQQAYHTDDISFRFKSAKQDGLIFQTRQRNGPGYMRCEMEGGKLKIRMNLDGDEQVFYVSQGFDDNQWHSAYIRRRAKHLEMWVDDDKTTRTVTLPNEDFFHLVDDVFIGGYLDGQNNPRGNAKNFVGYIRNFRLGGYDIFNELHVGGTGPFYKEPNVPPLVFGRVTFPDYDSNVQLPPINSVTGMNMNFRFKTFDENGIIALNEGSRNEVFVIELYRGKVRIQLNIPGKVPLEATTPPYVRFNDGNWHSVSVREMGTGGSGQLNFIVDGLLTSHTYSGLEQIQLQGPLYIGGVPASVLQKRHIKDQVQSTNGFRGCMASLDVGPTIPDLLALGRAQNVGIQNGCQEIRGKCTKDTCANGGICIDHLNNGTFSCNCMKTGYNGPVCKDEPLGYYFRSKGDPNLYGMMTYRYPSSHRRSNDIDEIVFGVMTDQEDGVLTRLESGTFDDFIQIKLVNGYVVVTYDTDGDGSPTTITDSETYVSDGGYHIIRFIRTAQNATLFVDSGSTTSTHFKRHGSFDNVDKIYIGGIYDETKGVMVNGTDFRGIMGGLYVNGDLIFPYAIRRENTVIYKDAEEAPIPYKLGPLKSTVKPSWVTQPTTPPPATAKPVYDIDSVPEEYGGGGAAWDFGPAGGVSVVVFPDGSGGTVSGLTAASIGPKGASIMVIPTFPTSGPRAGAVMGTILGLMLFASSLMWAFYGCKPGCCGAGSGGGGGGGPLTISAPSPTSPNAPLLLSDLGGNAGPPNVGNGGTGSGGPGGGDVDGGDMVDSKLLATTNLDDNMDSHVKVNYVKRSHLESTTSATSHSVLSPVSLQSYHYEGAGNSTTADYDLASGVHPSYRSNTLPLPVGGRGMSTGYSTSTLASNYNYTMRSVHMTGGGMGPSIIVTPGAMGEEVRVDCCLMTADGHSVVTGSSLGPPQVWNMENGELLRIMQGDTVGCTFLHLVCNDSLLVGAINADLEVNQLSMPKGVHNYFFQIWDFVTGRPFGMADQEICSALTVMSDSDKVVLGRTDTLGGGTNIIVWDLLGNQAMKEMRYDAPIANNDYISYIALSQNDRYVVAGFTNTFDNHAEFVIFDMTLTSYSVSDPHILRLDAVPDCTAIMVNDEAVTGTRNGELVIWSLRNGQVLRHMAAYNGRTAHTREIKAVARSEDSRYLVSASADGTLRVWDMEQERLLHTLAGHHDEVWCVTISQDSEIVVSGSRDGNIRLWKLRSGREICAFNAGVDVFYITMSRDKNTIVALGDKYGARKLIMLQVVRSKVKRSVVA